MISLYRSPPLELLPEKAPKRWQKRILLTKSPALSYQLSSYSPELLLCISNETDAFISQSEYLV